MATVTGVTAERAQEIEDASVVSAEIAGNDLVLVTHGGTRVNVGRIIPPAVDNWPIGSIFMTVDPANPATLLGGGTWVRWGRGRVPVSLDETQAEFDTVEEQGGAKTHTLSVAEIPSHNHSGVTTGQSVDHSHTGYTSTNGAHAHNYTAQAASPQTDNGSWNYYTGRVNAVTDTQGNHNHTVQTYGASTDHSHGVYAQGGSQAHNNLQPFITCYMWKRTA